VLPEPRLYWGPTDSRTEPLNDRACLINSQLTFGFNVGAYSRKIIGARQSAVLCTNITDIKERIHAVHC
jgi:hypothetical protein